MKPLLKKEAFLITVLLMSVIALQAKTTNKKNIAADSCELAIMVSTNDGESPEGACIELQNLSENTVYTDTIPAGGTVMLEVLQGDYLLTISKEGYYTFDEFLAITETYYIAEVVLVEIISPPQNLEIDVECRDVVLDWEEGSPEKNNSRELLGYSVYKNGAVINDSLITDTEYIDDSGFGGNHDYFVTSVYSTGESGTTDTLTADVDFINPPRNLTGDLEIGTGVQLDWNPPSEEQQFQIQWDDGENHTSVGPDDQELDFSVASRWYPEDLGLYHNMIVKEISFFPAEEDCAYYLRIWAGDEPELAFEQYVPAENLEMDEWNTVELDTLFTIDANQQFWFGYRANAEQGFPAGADEGPAITYHGDMFWDAEAGWASLKEAYGLDYNWNLAATILNQEGEKNVLTSQDQNNPKNIKLNSTTSKTSYQSSISENGDFFSYHIYRDDELLVKDWPQTSYLDENPDPLNNVHDYYVKAIYADGCISEPSAVERVSLLPTGNNEINKQKKIIIHPNPAQKRVNFILKNTTQTIRIYDNSGQLLYETNTEAKENLTLDVSDYEAGVYIAEFVTSEGERITNRFVVINQK